jgi:hypothetical protein
MKKFAQTAILIAGLAGLSACANNDVWTPYGSRTAGHNSEVEMMTKAPAVDMSSRGDMSALRMCRERENRLLNMNKNCYRK